MKIEITKLNSLSQKLSREEYKSRDNRENGQYWNVCWETFQEAERVLRALMGHWRFDRRYSQRLTWEAENFPEIWGVSSRLIYPPDSYFGGWNYIGKDIRYSIFCRYGKLHGKDIIKIASFKLEHGYMNAGNMWSNPVIGRDEEKAC